MLPLVVLAVLGATVAFQLRAERTARAGWYNRAEAEVAAGRYVEAIDAYTAAAGYRDADARRAVAVATLTPYRSAYLDGIAALDAGRYDDAIKTLLPVARDLPTYEDVTLRLADARRHRAERLAAEADAAVARHDWLAADRALALLAASNPDDAHLASRLATLRRLHAPIAFTRDHALYLIGPDLADERLVTDEVPVAWPAWSPDRTRIAFISLDPASVYENAQLYVVNVDGTGLIELTDGLVSFAAPAWSPDGSKIAYTEVATSGVPSDGTAISVDVVDVATRRVTNLTGQAFYQAGLPSWSPTGDRLAFISRGPADVPGGSRANESDVYLVTLATGQLTPVGRGRLPDAARVFWSPADDRMLVYARHQDAWRASGRSSISVLDATTGAISDVNTNSQEVSPPVWAPDGSRFAFIQGETVLRVVSDTGDDLWLTLSTPTSGFLSWSLDSQALLAAAADPHQPSAVIPVAGGVPPQTPLSLAYDADLGASGPPTWSPIRPLPVAEDPSLTGTALDPGRMPR